MDIANQKVVIIDYGAGNVFSVQNALKNAGVKAFVTNRAEDILKADKVIFPGVGSAKAAMVALESKSLIPVFSEITQPFLGICLGMQLMGDYSEEGDQKGLGIIPYSITAFKQMGDLAIPHMGWNRINHTSHHIWRQIPSDAYFYFVHSYHLSQSDYCIGNTMYGYPFCAAVNKDNFYGVQFHPEKSGDMGIRFLQNFLKL